MSMVVLVSASGSPGVSTTCLGLAHFWSRRTVLIEADPGGGSDVLAGWFNGHPPHDRCVVNLAMANAYSDQATDPARWLPAALDDVAVSVPQSTARVVTAVRSPSQAATLRPLWQALARTVPALSAGGTDVIVDAGRLGMEHAPLPLLDAADLVLLTVRSDLPALATAHGWSRELSTRFAGLGRADHLGLLLIGPGRPYRSAEMGDLLGLDPVASLPWNPDAARVLHLGSRTGWRRGLRRRNAFGGALRSAADSIQKRALRNAARLETATADPVLAVTPR